MDLETFQNEYDKAFTIAKATVKPISHEVLVDEGMDDDVYEFVMSDDFINLFDY